MSLHSDYWLKGYDWDFSIDEVDEIFDFGDSEDANNVEVENRNNLLEVIQLSQAKKAVSNYVNIISNKSIPVQFQGNNSYTNGEYIVIAADINKKNKFDSIVGLALHESSHIVHTDFNLFKTAWTKLMDAIDDDVKSNPKMKSLINDSSYRDFFQCIFNYVEDRYIDQIVYNNSPGYRPYYKSMYDTYFNCKNIDRALKSDMYRTPSLESYEFRIINLLNSNTDLNALPGLKSIVKTLDLKNIIRLKECSDRFDCAVEICKIVLNEINESSNTSESPNELTGEGGNTSTEISGSENGSENENSQEPLQKFKDSFNSENESFSSQKILDLILDKSEDDKLSESYKNRIKKSFEKQRNFIHGNVKKKKITSKVNKEIELVENSNTELVNVGLSYTQTGSRTVTSVPCVIVNNFTESLLKSDKSCPMSVFKFYSYYYKNNLSVSDMDKMDYVKNNIKSISEGIRLGTQIARRLQIRNEQTVEKFSRRSVGKIDKRLLHEIGFDNEDVFYREICTKYKDIDFHISVDASSSMYGSKWNKTMTLTVALAKAVTLLRNVRLRISFRTTSEYHPYVLMAYDSNKDKFSKIKSLFKYLVPANTTPEGLAFEGMIKKISNMDNDRTHYFINISDGCPCCTVGRSTQDNFHYSGQRSWNHTRNQINKIKDMGYNVISYFIGEHGDNSMFSDVKAFKDMYGKDAQYINVGNFNQITNTINSKMTELYQQ